MVSVPTFIDWASGHNRRIALAGIIGLFIDLV